MTTIVDLPTTTGLAQAHLDQATNPIGTLMMGHGAGGGPHVNDLAALAETLPTKQWNVVRFAQPFVVTGKKIGPGPAKLDPAFIEAIRHLATTHPNLTQLPVVLGGRSAGARVACRTMHHLTDTLDIRGLLLHSFPLHPPGKPEASRAAELRAASAHRPIHITQGVTDPFGRHSELTDADPTILITTVPGAHSFKNTGPVTDAAIAWLHHLSEQNSH